MTASVDHALILAGGRGSRLRPLTLDTPKPLLPLLGRSILHGWLRRLAGAGFARVDLLVGADPTPFIPSVAVGRRLGLHVTVRPEPVPLGSAGAVRAALPHRGDTVLVVNGDVATGASLHALLEHHRRHRPEVTLLLGPADDASEFGVVETVGSTVTRFCEKPPPGTAGELVNVGAYVVHGQALNEVPAASPCSLERDVLPRLLDQGRHIEGYRTTTPWADLGTPARYVNAHGAALAGTLTWPWPPDVDERLPGVWAHPTATIHPCAIIRPPVLLGAAVHVAAEAAVGPAAVLGRHVLVGHGASVANAVVHDRARVDAAASVQYAVIGHSAHVPVDARVVARAVSHHDDPPRDRRAARGLGDRMKGDQVEHISLAALEAAVNGTP